MSAFRLPGRDRALAWALAWAAAGTPLAVSLAANITWGLRTGSPTLVVAGAVTPLLLILAIERWRRMAPAAGAQRWVRTAAMAAVVVVVAGWSWLHATSLLLAEVDRLHTGPPLSGMDAALRAIEQVLCVLAPLAVDGLAVLSVLAMESAGPGDGSGPPGPEASEAEASSKEAPSRIEALSDDDLLALLRDAEPVPTSRPKVLALLETHGHSIGSGRADRLLAHLSGAGGPGHSSGPGSGPAAARANGHDLAGSAS